MPNGRLSWERIRVESRAKGVGRGRVQLHGWRAALDLQLAIFDHHDTVRENVSSATEKAPKPSGERRHWCPAAVEDDGTQLVPMLRLDLLVDGCSAGTRRDREALRLELACLAKELATPSRATKGFEVRTVHRCTDHPSATEQPELCLIPDIARTHPRDPPCLALSSEKAVATASNFSPAANFPKASSDLLCFSQRICRSCRVSCR